MAASSWSWRESTDPRQLRHPSRHGTTIRPSGSKEDVDAPKKPSVRWAGLVFSRRRVRRRGAPRAPRRGREARHGGVPGLLQRGRAGEVRPGRGPHPFLLVRRGREGLRRGREARPLVRHGLLGHRHEQLPSDLGAPEPRGARARQGGGGQGRVAAGPDGTGAGLHRRHQRVLQGRRTRDYGTRKLAFETAMEQVLRQEPRGPRGRHLLRPRPPGLRPAHRQDLRQAEAGGRDPERGPARAPRTTRASPTT